MHMLVTFKDAQKKTLVDVAETKKWRMAKGRYVPVTAGEDELDLRAVSFDSTAEFGMFLTNRLQVLAPSRVEQSQPAAKLGRLLKKHDAAAIPFLSRHALDDEDLMRDIADLLGSPTHLLGLHAKHVLLLEALSTVKRQLRDTQTAPQKS